MFSDSLSRRSVHGKTPVNLKIHLEEVRFRPFWSVSRRIRSRT